MKKILSLSMLFLALHMNAQDSRVIIKLKSVKGTEAIVNDGKSTGIARIDAINNANNYTGLKKLRTGKKSAQQAFVVTFREGTNTAKIINDYVKTGLVEYAETDAVGMGGGMVNNIPNDTHYARQWGLKNDGSFNMSPAVAGADIDMENAWAIEEGSSDIIVAVMDSGIKLDHTEFAGRIWTNTSEIANNGIDDDNNGYIDDVYGWNYAYENNDPTDDLGHGTNIAGIIGANGNNNLGYAGIDRNCKLMALKGLGSDNYGQYTWFAEAIIYATDNGAKVINLSVGGSTPSQLLREAVEYALENNVVVVACMMNFNTSVPFYPAKLNNVIAVGSTDPDDNRSAPFFWDPTSGSNYGSHISVVAPGNFIYGLSHLFSNDFETYWGGTSQAAPHVAGLASLLLAQNPTFTPAQIKAHIENTAEDQTGSALQDIQGFDIYYGHGRINAFNALSQPLAIQKNSVGGMDNFAAYPNPSNGNVTIKVNNIPANIKVYNSLGQLVSNAEINSEKENIILPSSGIYYISVSNKQGTSSKKIIVK